MLCLLLLSGGCAGTGLLYPNIPPVPEQRKDITNFAKWERVRDIEREHSSFSEAGLAAWPGELAEDWRRLRRRLINAPLTQQAVEVNSFFNAWPHREDRDVWGQEEYWATPLEFVNNGGDCEDYAIAKYYALRDLGVPAERLRIAGVWNREKGEGHGVLFVYEYAVAFVLDNTTAHVRPSTEVRKYIPKYFVNEEAMWVHEPARNAPE